MSGNGHDRAGSVAHHYVIGDPYRNLFIIYRIDGICACKDAGFLFFGRLPLYRALTLSQFFILLNSLLLTGRSELFDQRMLGSQHHKTRTPKSVGTGGIDNDLVTFLGLEADFSAFAAAYPVLLHKLDGFGPVDGLEVVDQAVGIGRDLKKPLREVFLFNERVASPAFAVLYFLVCKNSLARRAPVGRSERPVCQAFLIKELEYPLSPLVILGRAGVDLARPIVAYSDQVHLPFISIDILRHGLFRVAVLLYGFIFCGQAECIPTHRMEHIEAFHPFIAAGDIGGNIVSAVTYRKARAAGIRKEIEAVELRLIRRIFSFEEVGLLPALLPFLLYIREIILSVGHQITPRTYITNGTAHCRFRRMSYPSRL